MPRMHSINNNNNAIQYIRQVAINLVVAAAVDDYGGWLSNFSSSREWVKISSS